MCVILFYSIFSMPFGSFFSVCVQYDVQVCMKLETFTCSNWQRCWKVCQMTFIYWKLKDKLWRKNSNGIVAASNSSELLEPSVCVCVARQTYSFAINLSLLSYNFDAQTYLKTLYVFSIKLLWHLHSRSHSFLLFIKKNTCIFVN